jgi:hypothetical protein
MFDHLPEDFYLRRPIPVRLPADSVRGDFNGCWLIEGKSVPNIGSRGRTTASVSWTERSKKIDVSLGSQTLEDVESRLSDLDRFHIDCQIVFSTQFLAAVAEDVKLDGSAFTSTAFVRTRPRPLSLILRFYPSPLSFPTLSLVIPPTIPVE